MDILCARYVPPPIALLYVGTVWGGHAWVSLADYDDPCKHALPIYTFDARPTATTIQRGHITAAT